MSADASGHPASHPPAESLDSSLLRVLMDTSADRIYFKDRASRFVRNNAAHATSLGAASPEACVGKCDRDFFSPAHAAQAFADEQSIIQTGQPLIAKVERLTMLDGQHGWASSTKMPWRDSHGNIIGTFGLTRDITATKEAEDKLLEERNLLRTIIDHLPSRLYVKDQLSRYILNNRAHLAALGVTSQEEATGQTTTTFFPGERGRQALADDSLVLSGGHSVINQEKSDFDPAGDVHWSLVTKVPLRDTQQAIVGLVGISHDITRRKKAEEELRRRSAEMEADLQMARQVQESFLNRDYPIFPRSAAPAASALRFAHRYLPAETLGGDFFDIIQLSDTTCGVLICDVMGHGVRAGLLTALIRGVVEEMGPRAADPTHVLAEVNQSLMPIIEHTGQPVFATVFFGVIDTVAGSLTYGNAGHPAPLVRSALTGLVDRLAPQDPEPATGLLRDFAYTRSTCPFHPGDLFLGYTDGVIEATGASGVMFGETGVRAVLAATREMSGDQFSDELLTALRSASGRNTFEDDVCIVTIQSAQPAGPVTPV
ncbi:MAG: hypothetical protein RL077_4528 [Verrucomicrobiota bacterium]